MATHQVTFDRWEVALLVRNFGMNTKLAHVQQQRRPSQTFPVVVREPELARDQLRDRSRALRMTTCLAIGRVQCRCQGHDAVPGDDRISFRGRRTFLGDEAPDVAHPYCALG
jgi:hypothetical protein